MCRYAICYAYSCINTIKKIKVLVHGPIYYDISLGDQSQLKWNFSIDFDLVIYPLLATNCCYT